MKVITELEIKTLRDCIVILEHVRDATVSLKARNKLHRQIQTLFRLKHKAALLRFDQLQGLILPSSDVNPRV